MANTYGEQGASGQNYPCQSCGAKLSYDATRQAMRCPYCGAQQAVTQAATPQAVATREIPLEEGLRLAQRGYGAPVTSVSCNDCGATVTVNPGEQTAACAFCASHQILAREAAAGAIRPESMVPFTVDKTTANRTFEQWLGGLWFRPNDLKKMARLEQMGGVYIPFWTFDAHVYSQWQAEAGYYYYETEHYRDEQGNTQTRQVQRTRWEPAHGHRSDAFDDVIVCASKGLPEELVSRFRTFDTKRLVPYQPEYLAGWKAEFYAIDLMPAYNQAERIMASTQQERCGRDVPGDTHRGLMVQNSFSRQTFKHVLLPVWIAAYRYNGKPYQFLVNGQTGEVVGHAPYSFWKIFLLVLAIVAVVVAIAVIKSNASPGRSSPPRRVDSGQVAPARALLGERGAVAALV
ncbi:MAG: zinc ribbon domain-containing protein [Polyangiaceae bacterium]|nr:zinc ribbon domain-containing protein [Polyangiaceae bacterium]